MAAGEPPLVFLDRDGVLNELVLDPGSGRFESPYSAAEVIVPPESVEAVRRLRTVGAVLAIVSNQPAAAKGTASLDDLGAVHDAVVALYAAAGIRFDTAIYCHHHPDAINKTFAGPCGCRKPAPGMLVEAARRLGRESISGSWLIGDSDVDILAGAAVGATTVLVENPLSAHRRRGVAEPDYRTPSVLSAAEIVAAHAAPESAGDQ